MGNLNHSMQEQPLLPLLYVENLPEKQTEIICRQFSLKSERSSSGYLLHSSGSHSNFKISFLDLFFGALSSFAHYPDITFLLFEKNLLREELESSIIGTIQKETLVEDKIREWKRKNNHYSLSGFAQAALHQAGFINTIEAVDLELNSEQLNKILDTNLSLRVKTNKVA